ncbi:MULTISPECIES: zinc-binding alcohol dehydrogenase family protein [unclassified Neorhizobium]|uniref:zinc-binding alcohol dehydrogenase family protein n=1 Tax=unclassified Neorhizobium TaxID=2629175 RepID=UPI001FF12EB4|nr:MULTISPECIES: zinc-binding alcohol dehydrogenase family protein [unclassified Neorhizobium]MCJ9669729.1 zinc-binding alcohol dehydrogenase family protein [Neorhizobium sp. SHOUNA12B]MCJ9746069.1 zinc-binding alcohol dehydrogenase family protein [Neorhizobium sp. SHOUNA12A]
MSGSVIESAPGKNALIGSQPVRTIPVGVVAVGSPRNQITSKHRGENMDHSIAAWQPDLGQPLQLAPIEAPQPGPNEILVRNRAIAINPVDWLLQDTALFPWLDYPAILGSDVAGDVVAVGTNVVRFKVGDRVLGQAVGATTNRPAHGAFQSFTLVLSNMASKIPSNISYVNAAVLPLGLGTAACGLFEKNHLGLEHPSLTPKATGKTILVWGGSSSVGCNAIQLAVAAGYECITTASPHNMDMVKSLGATLMFDHADKYVVDQVVEALRGREFVGALHATGNIQDCFSAISVCDGRRFVSTTLPPPTDLAAGVETRLIFGTSLKDNEVSKIVYVDFLADALAGGKFQPAPPAQIAGHGLESLQTALHTQKSGMSGAKVVVSLEA